MAELFQQPAQGPQEAPEQDMEIPVGDTLENPDVAPVAPEPDLQPLPDVKPWSEEDFDLQSTPIMNAGLQTTEEHEKIRQQQEFWGEDMETDGDEDVSTSDLFKRAVSHNVITVSAWNLAEDVITKFVDPEYFKEDPQFKGDSKEYEHLPFHLQTHYMSAKNKAQWEEAKARVNSILENEAVWSNASWAQYLAAGTVSVAAEIVVGIGASLATGGVAGAVGLTGKGLSVASRISRFKSIAGNARYLGAIKAGQAGIVGGALEGGFVYSQGTVSAQEYAMYPLMGGIFGGIAGAAAPHMLGGVTKKPVAPVDNEMAHAEAAEWAAAGVVREMRENGDLADPKDLDLTAKVKLPDVERSAEEIAARQKFRKERPDLDPDEWVAGKDSEMDRMMSDMADPPDEATPRLPIFEEDAVQVVREKGMAKEADANLDKDLDVLGVQHSRPHAKTLKRDAKEVGEAFRRQGYRLEKTRKVFMSNHPDNHKFAQHSGQNIRHGFDSEDAARKFFPDGAKLIEVEVPAGSKVIDGAGLGDDIGNPGEIILGQGKGHVDANGKVTWRPKQEIRGNPQVVRAKTAEGANMPEAIRKAHNDIADQYNGDLPWHEANNPGASLSAAVVIKTRHNMDHSDIAKQYLLDPHAGMEKLTGISLTGEGNQGITRAGRALSSPLNIIRNVAPDLYGGVLDVGRKSLDMDKWGSGGSDIIGGLNNADQMTLNTLETQMFHQWLREAKAAGLKLSSWNRVDTRNKFNEMAADFRSLRFDQKPITPDLDLPSIRKYNDELDKWYLKKLEVAQDPAKATGDPTKFFEPVGGSEGRQFKPGYAPFKIDNNKIHAIEEKLGAQGILTQAYQGILYDNARRATNGSATVVYADFKELANVMADAQMSKGGSVNFMDGHMRAATSSDSFLKLAANNGVDPATIARLKPLLERYMKTTEGSARAMNDRLNFSMTQDIRIRLDNGGFDTIQMKDLAYNNLLTNSQNYAKDINGWIGLATTARRAPDGTKMTHQIPELDPATGLPMKDAQGNIILKTVPWTLRNQNEVDKFVRDIHTQNVEQGNIDDKGVAALEEGLLALLNRSNENPHPYMDMAVGLNIGATMGQSGWTAIQEFGMIAKTGFRNMAELPKMLNFVRGITDTYNYMYKGEFTDMNGDAVMDFVREVSGGASAARRLRGAQSYQWDNAQYSQQNSGMGQVKGALAKRAQQTFTEGTLRWSGMIGIQDSLQGTAIKGMFHNVLDYAHKYAKATDMPKRHLHEMQRWGMTVKEIDEVLDWMRSDSIKWETGALGGRKIKSFDKNHPSWNEKAARMMSQSSTRVTSQKIIMEPAAGAKIPGTDKGIWPLLLQLQSFQMGSASQMLRNYAQTFGEGVSDMATGSYGGRIDGMKTTLSVAGVLAMSMTAAWLVEIGKQEYKNWNLSDKEKEKLRAAYTDPTWLANTAIDKSGITAIIPWLYDSTWAPAVNAPSFAGYKDYDNKRTGFEGALEGLLFGNISTSQLGKMGDFGDAALNVAGGKGTQKDAHKLTFFSNMWALKDAMTIAMNMLGVDPGKPKKFKELDNKNPVSASQEAFKNNKGFNKAVKKSSEALDFWFGD